jgi:hypothetical protein
MRSIPLPFLRSSLTIAPPWDADGALTVEVVVLPTGYGCGTAEGSCGRAEDFPFLNDAGWKRAEHLAVTVFTRIVGE